MKAGHFAMALRGLASDAHFLRELVSLGIRTEEDAKTALARSAETIIEQNETTPFQANALRSAGRAI